MHAVCHTLEVGRIMAEKVPLYVLLLLIIMLFGVRYYNECGVGNKLLLLLNE